MEYQKSSQFDYVHSINSVNSQLQDFSMSSSIGSPHPMSGSSTPLSGVPHLHRSTSLMDTLGIQRTHSPFESAASMKWSSGPNSNPTMNHGIPVGGSADIGIPAPPGLTLNAKQISWKYLDQTHQVQGPFDSQLMDQWYNSGFFNESLQLMPIQSLDPFQFSNRFIAFAELLRKTGTVNPFHTFDMICSNANPNINQVNNINQTSFFGSALPTSNQPVMGLHQQFDAPLFDTTPTLQNMQYTGSQLNIENPVELRENFQSPDLSHSEILQLKSEDGSYYHDTVVTVPYSKNIQVVDSFNQPKSGLESDKKRTIIQPPIKYSTESKTSEQKKEPVELPSEKPKSEVNSTDFVKNISEDEKQETFTPAEESIPNNQTKKDKSFNDEIIQQLIIQEELERKKKEEKKKKKEQQQQQQQQQKQSKSDSLSTKSKDSFSNDQNHSEAHSNEHDISSPWSAPVKPAVQTINLSDIQKRDAEEKRRREQEREKREREAALKLQRALLEEEKKNKINVSSVATWANQNKLPLKVTTTPLSTSKPQQTQETSVDKIKYIEEQRKILEDIQKSQSQSKPEVSGSLGGWSSIAKKKALNEPLQSNKQVSNSFLHPGNSNSKKKILHGSTISIPTLKKGNSTTPTIAYAGNQSTSARKQFLSWCRSQMKLSPGVKVDSVLEMLLSLPPTMDSKEIISDTIYANSSVMEGRSFASEFIKRRIECEKSLNDPLTWSEALSLPQGDSDDWEFQVVSKKKGKKF